MPAHALEIGVEASAGVELVHDRLRQEGRGDVRRDRAVVVRGAKRLGHHEPPDAQSRRDRLRERRGEGHPLAAFELVQRPGRDALVADEPVGVVLEHVDVVLPAELGDTSASLLAERATAGVLEGRDGVEERDVASAGELRLERLRVEPFVVHLERDDVDPLPAQELQRAIVGRALDEHAPGTKRELRGDVEDEPLQSTRREEDPARVDPVTLAEQLPQRPVPATGAVREDRPTVALERHAGAVREQLGVEAGRRGCASGERDRCHPSSLPPAPAGAAATVHHMVDLVVGQ